MRATIREHVVYESLHRGTVPERLTLIWTLLLLGVDVLAVLASAFAAGFSPAAGPAACVLICGAMALCGAYQTSHAVAWRDEAYHVATGIALAAIPVWLAIHAIAGYSTPSIVLFLVIAAVIMSLMHGALHRARRTAERMPPFSLGFISPEAQWRVAHSPYRFAKRGFDIALSAFALLLLAPAMLLIALCIAIETGMPVFFRQERVGRGGRPFTMYKFRTMYQNAGDDWASPGDARITPLGAILRRTSLDELPQLFNVLFGDMSLVGPRPEMREFADEFSRRVHNYDERHVVEPGLTGWAQVQLKRNLQPSDMPAVIGYDLFYVENASLVLDSIVIAKTAFEFLLHRAV